MREFGTEKGDKGAKSPRGEADIICLFPLRGLPLSMSANFSGFWTPSLPFSVPNSRNLPSFGQKLAKPLPLVSEDVICTWSRQLAPADHCIVFLLGRNVALRRYPFRGGLGLSHPRRIPGSWFSPLVQRWRSHFVPPSISPNVEGVGRHSTHKFLANRISSLLLGKGTKIAFA